MSDHRWQGHTHAELFEQIHEGPGPDASTTSVQRWIGLRRALAARKAPASGSSSPSGSPRAESPAPSREREAAVSFRQLTGSVS